ncbi:MAG: ATPase [Candidatus Jacksonbacteria bacterium RIFOXYB2_FULL_44_15]|nr:MAG: ATPase [Candidatus Jacksonbacteria bacterium RIFOXYB2_FULL_44_15]OGY80577.1 MAG: ATPase [Candidatus Jacksonbacteria bacterium RIFOXYD2_FULL_43_21]
MFYPRKIYTSLKSHLAKKQITILTGMRRVGKTTLVKQLLSEIPSKNKVYFDLERLDNRELFSEKNYEAIISAFNQRGLDLSKKLYVAIDEIQLSKNISSVLKYLYDNYDIKFILTGSSSFYLKNFFSESLAGRKKIFELFPLDFGEFLAFKSVNFKLDGKIWQSKFQLAEYERLKSYYEDYLAFGGFPEVVLAKTQQDKKDLLSDIISSYINIDVASLSDFREQKSFYDLTKLLAGRVASRLDYTKLSRLSGLSRPTVINYLEFLEKTYVIVRIPVFSKNLDREIVKAKKLYFCDNGLMNILAQASSGVQFENAVFNQLRHCGELSYYALKTGQKIDFVLDKKLALEAKETPTQGDIKSLSALAGMAGLKSCRLIGRLVSPRFKDYIWGGDIK